MNKELAMHGATHEYKEFGVVRNEKYLQVGLMILKNVLDYPEKSKPPNLEWTYENNWMKNKFKIQNEWNQLTH